MLISQTELDSRNSRDIIPLECIQCGKTHYRTKNIVLRILNGNLQNTMKGCFCSIECRGKYKQVDKIKCTCKNCGHTFDRIPSEIGENTFCNKSCAASFNNTYKLKSTSNRKCVVCNSLIIRKSQKYCSLACQARKRHEDTWNDIENGNVSSHHSKTIKSYLLNKRGCKCEMCGITEWLKQPLTLVLDHINGNSEDWNLTNLRLICSNCDTLTPTYKNKNKGNGRHYRRMRYATGKSY